ncbi:hypothetical protein PIB30_062066 [Stylosanthes scabra]|uniref:Protein FAR1-RELATED SEQUENCE n=1 Tax=Stylosanthes scabra TaxID=79078 RepID=A0ABU6UNF5_9FABA|nr:hypothetical protein [Stylosanthes scabra]
MDSESDIVDCCPQSSDEDPGEVSHSLKSELTNASKELQHKIPLNASYEQVPRLLKSLDEEEPDHSNLCEDEIPKEDMCFESCAEAHEFYKKDLSLHAKCVIQDNDEADIRPNMTYFALSNEVGGSSNMNFSKKDFDNVLENKEQKELEDDAADSKVVIQCVSSSMIELQFHKEYTTHMFRDVQVQFLTKRDSMVQVLSREGDMYSLKVDELKLICHKPVIDTYRVSFDSIIQESHCECNFFQPKAILCRHMISTFAYFQVNQVPTCYIWYR